MTRFLRSDDAAQLDRINALLGKIGPPLEGQLVEDSINALAACLGRVCASCAPSDDAALVDAIGLVMAYFNDEAEKRADQADAEPTLRITREDN